MAALPAQGLVRLSSPTGWRNRPRAQFAVVSSSRASWSTSSHGTRFRVRALAHKKTFGTRTCRRWHTDRPVARRLARLSASAARSVATVRRCSWPGAEVLAKWNPRDAGLLGALSFFGRRSRLHWAKRSSQHVSAQLNVPKLTEPVSSLRYNSTTRPRERGHEAGAAMQAAGPYALWVFV